MTALSDPLYGQRLTTDEPAGLRDELENRLEWLLEQRSLTSKQYFSAAGENSARGETIAKNRAGIDAELLLVAEAIGQAAAEAEVDRLAEMVSQMRLAQGEQQALAGRRKELEAQRALLNSELSAMVRRGGATSNRNLSAEDRAAGIAARADIEHQRSLITLEVQQIRRDSTDLRLQIDKIQAELKALGCLPDDADSWRGACEMARLRAMDEARAMIGGAK